MPRGSGNSHVIGRDGSYSLRVRRWCSCGKRMDTHFIERRKALDWEAWFLRNHYGPDHESLHEDAYWVAHAEAMTAGGK